MDDYKRGLLNGTIIASKSKIEDLKFQIKQIKISLDCEEKYLKDQESQLAEIENPNSGLLKKLNGMLGCYPEYSTVWIQCISFKLTPDRENYSELTFNVMNDADEFQEHSITAEDLIESYNKYGAKLEEHYGETCEYFDQEGVDSFMQYHFFGSLVYG